MKEFVYKAKADGEDVALSLSPMEVETGLSICVDNNLKEVYVLCNTSAVFYASEANAIAAQEEYKFDYLFSIEHKALDDHAKKEKIGPYAGQTQKPPKLN